LKKSTGKSLRQRTLIFIGTSLLLTISAIATIATVSSLKVVRKHIEKNLLNDVEKSSLELSRIIEGHLKAMSLIATDLSEMKVDIREQRLARFVSQYSPNTVAVEVSLKDTPAHIGSDAFAFTSQLTDPRFEDKTAESVKAKIRKKIQKSLRSPKASERGETSVSFDNLYFDKEIRLPLVIIEIRSQTSKNGPAFTALIVLWQSELTQALGRNKESQGFLVSKDGDLLASEYQLNSTQSPSIGDLSIVSMAKRSSLKTGFNFDYPDSKGNYFSGSFYRLAQWDDLIVVSQQSGSSIQRQAMIFFGQNFAVGLFLTALFVFGASMFSNKLGIEIRELNSVIRKIGLGDFSTSFQLRRRDEMGLLGATVNQTSVQIQALIKASAERIKAEKDFETAQAVHTSLMTNKNTERKYLAISGFYQPAGECRGDIWGNLSLGDNIELIYICDSMERGVAAATVATVAYSAFQMIDYLIETKIFTDRSASGILKQVNNFLLSAGNGKMSLTCFVVVVDLNAGTLTYSNAGHNFPVLLPAREFDPRSSRRKSRALQKASTISPINLVQKGMPLGIRWDYDYKEKQINVSPGDKIVLFSNGLVDGESPTKRRWGRKSLILNLLRHINQGHQELKEKIIEKAFRFYGSGPLKDDISLIIAEVSSLWRSSRSDIPEKFTGKSVPFLTAESKTSIPFLTAESKTSIPFLTGDSNISDPIFPRPIDGTFMQDSPIPPAGKLILPLPPSSLSASLSEIDAFSTSLNRTVEELEQQIANARDSIVAPTIVPASTPDNSEPTRTADVSSPENLTVWDLVVSGLNKPKKGAGSNDDSSDNSISLDLEGDTAILDFSTSEPEPKIPLPMTRPTQGILSVKPGDNDDDGKIRLGSFGEDTGPRKMAPPGVLSSTAVKGALATKAGYQENIESSIPRPIESQESKVSGNSDEKTSPRPIGRLSMKRKIPDAG
jgi:serine phosphatase RsbU (regulator of sigma subunit)